ncbi:Flagellar regulatory protein FleQ [hydrothermal vent metagenome]|uniref:Flagellar regulatory protein FleQ n=1 Tax=hydrothermal vent metagenome TaxID=652676 RepID=A0A3B1C5T9_9ZZZZ
MENKRILIVDDTPENVELLSVLIERNDWAYKSVNSGAEGLKIMEKEPYDLVLADLMMPHMNGLELLDKIKELWPGTEVVIITAFGSIPTAIEAIKKGAYTYLLRPFEPEEVELTIKKIFEFQNIRSENTMLREELSRILKYDTIVSKSFTMKKIFQQIDSLAKTSSTVLIQGESGVGKELIARAIHNKSQRANQPFIKVSCAALSEHLLESELFGHEKGAFTGAISSRKGRFELADKGALFLDEIGEISLPVQVKLLRATQEREFERVGGGTTLKTDARIISATNKNLTEQVAKGAFREDLFYRLNVITLEIPPLRERREDISMLAYHFLKRFSEEMNKDAKAISDEALGVLTGYQWPGNIRELQNVIERAVVLSTNQVIETSDLPENIRPARIVHAIPEVEPEETVPLRIAKSAWEKKYIEKALSRHNGNISRTAEAIELARKNLQEKIKQHAIEAKKFAGKNAGAN